MRFKKTIFLSIVVLVIFLTYLFFNDNRINYVVLGDSVAAGVNPYGGVGYSYSDYIKDYLCDKGKLKEYIKEYAFVEATIDEIIIRGKTKLEDFEDYKGLTTKGYLPEGVKLTFRP